MNEPRLFTLIRNADESGVSGTGRVLDGAYFHTGQVVICWRTDVEAAKHGHSSLGIYPSWEAFQFIHIKSHPTNETAIAWLPLVPLKPKPPCYTCGRTDYDRAETWSYCNLCAPPAAEETGKETLSVIHGQAISPDNAPAPVEETTEPTPCCEGINGSHTLRCEKMWDAPTITCWCCGEVQSAKHAALWGYRGSRCFGCEGHAFPSEAPCRPPTTSEGR